MLVLRFLRVKALRIFMASMLACYTWISAVSCDPAFGINLKGYTNMSEDLGSAWRRTASFRYIPDDDGYWKSPEEFEHDGGGDCEDFSSHLMYHLGDTSRLYFIKLNGHATTHAIVKFEGKFIEPQVYQRTYDLSEFTVVSTLSYEKAMQRSTFYGLKNETDGNGMIVDGVKQDQPEKRTDVVDSQDALHLTEWDLDA